MLIIGHRGVRNGSVLENTIAAFEQALADGADGIECDVHATADGTPILYHDPSLPLSLGEGSRRVREISVETLQKHCPTTVTLRQFAAWLETQTRSFFLNLEVKDLASVVPATHLLATLTAQGWPREQLLLSSFDTRALEQARQNAPHIPRAIVSEGFVRPLPSLASELQCEAVVLYAEWFDEEVSAAFPPTIGIFVWPVNTADEQKRLNRFNLRGVVSDDPAKLREALNGPPRFDAS